MPPLVSNKKRGLVLQKKIACARKNVIIATSLIFVRGQGGEPRLALMIFLALTRGRDVLGPAPPTPPTPHSLNKILSGLFQAY